MLISGASFLFLIVGGSFLIYKNNSAKTNNLSPNQPYEEEREPVPPKDNPPSDQPNNPPQSPPPKPGPNPTERSKRVREFLAQENEFLLKTNPKLVPIPDDFIGELLEKGYDRAGEIRRLFDWGLTAQDIPDLNSAKRIGVTKILTVAVEKDKKEEEWKGYCEDLVVIVKENSANQSGPIMNIDGRVLRDKPEFPYVQEIITLVLAQENKNPHKWEVFYLYANGSGKPYYGKSAGIALYFALLSALHKKPLPNDLASTGELVINEQKVLPVGSIVNKIGAAFEEGMKNLIFPRENVNLKRDTSEKTFPIKDELQTREMTGHLVENLHDLKDIFETLI